MLTNCGSESSWLGQFSIWIFFHFLMVRWLGLRVGRHAIKDETSSHVLVFGFLHFLVVIFLHFFRISVKFFFNKMLLISFSWSSKHFAIFDRSLFNLKVMFCFYKWVYTLQFSITEGIFNFSKIAFKVTNFNMIFKFLVKAFHTIVPQFFSHPAFLFPY